jgi:cell division protein FtsI (penicillin-binding protein 3)
MLERVTQDGGTAPMARVAGYRVAGKTGTAHKLVDGSYAGTATSAPSSAWPPPRTPAWWWR